MTRKYWESADSDETIALQPGAYDVEVTDAREVAESSLIFMDLLVLRGPDKGSATSVSLYCPEDGEKGVFYFKKKAAGFADVVKAVIAKADDGEEVGLLATELVGARFNATLGIQTKGAYEGRQELVESRPLDADVRLRADLADGTVTPIAKGEIKSNPEPDTHVAEQAAPDDDELPF